MFGGLFGGGKKKPEPATEKQRKFADDLGIKNAEMLSKDQASDAITKKLDAKARRRKGWISSLKERIEALEKKAGKKAAKKTIKKKKK